MLRRSDNAPLEGCLMDRYRPSNDLMQRFARRVAFYGINDDTRHNMAQFRPVMEQHLDGLIKDFYRYLRAMPEARGFIADDDMVARLVEKQRRHWERLFTVSLDESYLDSALMVGRVHHLAGVPVYLYIAGYNRFLCEFLRITIAHYAGVLTVTGIVTAITRLVHLDMDLALSVYVVEVEKASSRS